MGLPYLDKNATVADVMAEIDVHGCAIVRELVEPELMDRISEELAPYFVKTQTSEHIFWGSHTQRTLRLIAKSPSTHGLIVHPLVLGVVEELFRGQCYNFTLNWTEANRVHPGQVPQMIHRDDTMYPFKHPCAPLLANIAWAMTDFTEENGATRVVPGSHLWDEERKPTEDELECAAMPKGSVLIFNSALYHGCGGNRTEDDIREALLINYCVGWLRQSENQYLAVPIELAKTLPEELQRIVGYSNHGSLGHYELQVPSIVLGDGPPPEGLPGGDLVPEELRKVKLNLR